MPKPLTLHRMCRIGTMLLGLALLAGCVGPQSGRVGAATALLNEYPPPGLARIWIFRTYDPYITLETPYIRINGRIVGVAWLGSAFYRDVPPGRYAITVDSRGSAPNQFANIGLAARQTAYIQIDANNWWAGMCWRCSIPTFYTYPIGPRLARLAMAPLTLRASE
ncbi:MAG: hypothetical protein ACREFQ_05100 [Stellaceae bacterium]